MRTTTLLLAIPVFLAGLMLDTTSLLRLAAGAALRSSGWVVMLVLLACVAIVGWLVTRQATPPPKLPRPRSPKQAKPAVRGNPASRAPLQPTARRRRGAAPRSK